MSTSAVELSDVPLVGSVYQLMPALSEDRFQALKADIAQHGVLVPIEVDQSGMVLDGHHRLRAYRELRSEGVGLPKYPRIVRQLASTDDKIAHALELNLNRRHLSMAERKAIAEDLRQRGWSVRRIADVVGVGRSSISRDLAGVPDGTPDVIAGADGKRYRIAPRPAPAIMARTDAEERRATRALSDLDDDAPEGMIDLRRAETSARMSKLDRLRQDSPKAAEGTDWHISCTPIGELDVADHSVDLVLTDPPYADETLPCFSELGCFAGRVLKEGGLLVCYVGKLRLPDEMAMLGEHLKYLWTGTIIQPGPHSVVHARMIRARNRPVLFYSAGPYRPRRWIDDSITSQTPPEKDLHPWQQTLSPFVRLVEMCSAPGDLVCDPFLGSGTTAVAAIGAGRCFVGADIDPAAIALTTSRLASLEGALASSRSAS
jgi:ParB-like chromosome segregation protein Spo0J